MRVRMLVLVVFVGAAALATSQVCSGEKSGEPDRSAAEEQEMMDKWQEMSLPGPQHEFLERFTGVWDVTTRYWVDADKPPVESPATVKSKMIFGGRFIQTEMTGIMRFETPEGDMMELPFEGIGFVGYNNFRKKFESVWIDSQGTAIMYMRGSPDDKGTTITYYAEGDDWHTGERDVPILWVERFVDSDTIVSTMYRVAAGDRVRVFEMESHRRKR